LRAPGENDCCDNDEDDEDTWDVRHRYSISVVGVKDDKWGLFIQTVLPEIFPKKIVLAEQVSMPQF
jgi:hypothetical protein